MCQNSGVERALGKECFLFDRFSFHELGSDQLGSALSGVRCPAFHWSSGLVAAVLAIGFAYRSQRSFTIAVNSRREEIEHSLKLRLDPPRNVAENMLWWGRQFQWAGLIFGLISLAFFMGGVFASFNSLPEALPATLYVRDRLPNLLVR